MNFWYAGSNLISNDKYQSKIVYKYSWLYIYIYIKFGRSFLFSLKNIEVLHPYPTWWDDLILPTAKPSTFWFGNEVCWSYDCIICQPKSGEPENVQKIYINSIFFNSPINYITITKFKKNVNRYLIHIKN